MQDKSSRPPSTEPSSSSGQQVPGLHPYPPPSTFYAQPPAQYSMPPQGPYPQYGSGSGYPSAMGPGPGLPPPPMPPGLHSVPHYAYHGPPPPIQSQPQPRSNPPAAEAPGHTAQHDVFGAVRYSADHPPAAHSAMRSASQMDLDYLLGSLTADEVNQFSCDVVPTDFNIQDPQDPRPSDPLSTPLRVTPPVNVQEGSKGFVYRPGAPISRSQSIIPAGTPKSGSAIRRATSQRPAADDDCIRPLRLPGVIPESSHSAPDPFSSPPLTPERGHSPETATTPNQGVREGRISDDHMRVIREAVLQAERTLRDAAEQTGLTMDIVTSQYNDMTAGGMVLQITPWNYYTSYIHTAPYDECKRLGIAYVPGKTTPTGEHFASFKKHKGPKWLEWLMLQYSMKVIKKGTIAELEREHAKFVKRVVALITAAQERWGFQSLFLTCGTSVNENQSIGTLHLTNYLRNFTKARLKMTPDSLIGHTKTHAYHEVSLEHAQRAADDRKAEAEKAGHNPSSSYIPVNDDIINSGSTIEVIGLPPSPSAAVTPVPSRARGAATPSISRVGSTTANVKLEGSPAFVPTLTSTVGASDSELREAAKAIGNPKLIAELEDLLAKNKEEHFGVGLLADPARAFVKMWMAISFALLGLEFRPTDSHFDWAGFPTKFAQAGIRLTGWPTGIPFPGENISGKEKKGIRVLLAEPARNVAKSMRFGRIGMTLRTEDIPDLLSSKKPIYEEAAPPASDTRRARRYFLNAFADNKGLRPLGSRAKSTTRSATARSSKQKGKSRQVEESNDDDDDDDYDDDDSQPTPPPSQYRRSRTTTPSPYAGDSDGDSNKPTTTPRPRRQKQHTSDSPGGWKSDDLYASDDPTTPTIAKGAATQHASARPGSAVRVPAKQKPAPKRKAGTIVSSSDETPLGTGVAPEKRPRTEVVVVQQPASTSTTTTTTTTSVSVLVPPVPPATSHQANSKSIVDIGNTMPPGGPSTKNAPPPSATHANQHVHLPPAPPMPMSAGPMHPGSISTAPGSAVPPTQPGAPAPDGSPQWPYGQGAYYQPHQSFYPPQPPYYGHQAPYFPGGYPQHPPHPAYAYQHQYQQGIPPTAGQNAPPPPFTGHQAATNDHQPPSNSNTPPQAGGTGA